MNRSVIVGKILAAAVSAGFLFWIISQLLSVVSLPGGTNALYGEFRSAMAHPVSDLRAAAILVVGFLALSATAQIGYAVRDIKEALGEYRSTKQHQKALSAQRVESRKKEMHVQTDDSVSIPAPEAKVEFLGEPIRDTSVNPLPGKLTAKSALNPAKSQLS